MATVTVHNFMVPDIREGDLVEAKGKCTREMIESLRGVVIERTAQTVDESLLNENGRYHELSPNPAA